jgi:hypothetical protein
MTALDWLKVFLCFLFSVFFGLFALLFMLRAIMRASVRRQHPLDRDRTFIDQD